MGLSKLITDAALESGVNSIMTSGGGLNPRWLAPEVLSGDNCNVASDVYSFAMVMWEILTRRLPWEGKSPWSVVGDVQRGERPPIDLDTIEIDDQGTNREKDTSVMEYIEIMEACWKQNPDDRPDFAYVASKLRELQRNLIQKSC
jgi:serine/threonine protein kinase